MSEYLKPKVTPACAGVTIHVAKGMPKRYLRLSRFHPKDQNGHYLALSGLQDRIERRTWTHDLLALHGISHVVTADIDRFALY